MSEFLHISSLQGQTQLLYFNHGHLTQTQFLLLGPLCAVTPEGAGSITPAKGLSWALCWEMDGSTVPKSPQSHFPQL